MNDFSISIFFWGSLIIVLVLSLCIIYLVFAYRKLLDRYTDLNIDEVKSEARKRINLDTTRFFDSKVDSALSTAVSEAVDLIGKNADSVAQSMRKKTIEKLSEEEKAQEQAVAFEYDKVRSEIEGYKTQKFEEIRLKANEILAKVAKESLSEVFDKDKQEKLILKALEDAKQQKLL